jgi:hypothetical protein
VSVLVIPSRIDPRLKPLLGDEGCERLEAAMLGHVARLAERVARAALSRRRSRLRLASSFRTA